MVTTASVPLDVARLAQQLKVLAEPNRLRIINLLLAGMQCNCELAEQLQLAPNLISHHMSVLHKAGLVSMARDPLDARWIYYSLQPEAMAELNRAFGAFFDPARLQQRQPSCSPRSALVPLAEIKRPR